MPKSLRVRLVLWTVLLEAILLLIFSAVLLVTLRNQQSHQNDETLRSTADQLNAVVDVEGTAYRVEPPTATEISQREIAAWVLDLQGNVVATVGTAQADNLPHSLPTTGEFADQRVHGLGEVRVLVVPFSEDGRRMGTLVLALSLDDGREFLQQILIALAAALPLILLLSAGGGFFLANRALAPVTRITTLAQQITSDDLSQRLNLTLPDDEIGQLAQTLDAMLERLDRAFQRERQLTSDIAHDLRTPLAALKMQVGLAQSRPREAPALLHMMRAMETDIDRLTRLVEQSLTLARVEQNGLGKIETVNLGALLESLGQSFEAQATARGIIWQVTIPDGFDFSVRGDPDQLAQIFINLFDNALKYSRDDGTISVTISQSDQVVTTRIADTGVGIAPEHLPHLFERFYRVDGARQTGGFGLGLAIAQALAQAQDGQISVTSTVGQGTTFAVNLPRA